MRTQHTLIGLACQKTALNSSETELTDAPWAGASPPALMQLGAAEQGTPIVGVCAQEGAQDGQGTLGEGTPLAEVA